MLKHRFLGLAAAMLATIHIGCESCDAEEEPVKEAPEFTSEPVTTAAVGEDYRYLLGIAGSPEPTVVVTGADGGEYPGWLAFDTETLTLLGRPTESQIGVHGVVLTASNGVEPDAVQSFEITVSLQGVAPEFVSDPSTEASTGEEYRYSAIVSGVPEPVLAATDDQGGPLPEWLLFDVQSGTLSGTPAEADVGDHAVMLTASNGVEPDAVQPFTITVERSHEEPEIISSPVLDVVEGEEYVYEVVATGHPPPVIAAGGAEDGELPEWLLMEDGVLSGTPGSEDVGEHEMLVVATNAAGTASQEFVVTVARAPAPAEITSVPVEEAVVDESYAYQVIATGHPEPTIEASGAEGAALSAWLTFDGGTNTLSGTPSQEDARAHEIVIVASNSSGADYVQSFAIEVFEIDDVAGFDFDAEEEDERPLATVAAPGVSVGPFTFARVSGAAGEHYTDGNPGHAISIDSWHDEEDPNYFEFEVTPEEGAELRLYRLVFDDRASQSGPLTWEVLLIEDDVEISMGTGETHEGFSTSPMNVVFFEAPGDGPFMEAFKVRLQASGASDEAGSWCIDNVVLTGWVD